MTTCFGFFRNPSLNNIKYSRLMITHPQQKVSLKVAHRRCVTQYKRMLQSINRYLVF